MITVTKQYHNFPAAHRQPKHDGHCRLIHGHNWGFELEFACDRLDENGFVVDVGKLKFVKDWLDKHFDHTLLLNHDDPSLPAFKASLVPTFANIVVVPNCGMEGLAKFVFDRLNDLLCTVSFKDLCERDLRVVRVTCWEDSKNSATYRNND